MHIVDAKQIFPGAKIQPPPQGHKGFDVANGQRLRHQGFINTNVKTVEGEDKSITWKHGDVALPILSTHELARNHNRLEYDEDEGWIRNKVTGKTTRFIQAGGVQFAQLLVPKHIAKNPFQPFTRQG